MENFHTDSREKIKNFNWISPTIDQFLSCFATLQENAIDWIGGAIHTMDTIPSIKRLRGNVIVGGLLRVNDVSGDQSTDLRVHITGILYDSRAAPVSIVFSIGGCVSTTTSTNKAPTTTTARRHQLLLADFMSGGWMEGGFDNTINYCSCQHTATYNYQINC